MNKYAVHLLDSKSIRGKIWDVANNLQESTLALPSITSCDNLVESSTIFCPIERFVNLIMKNGQKTKARALAYEVLIALHELTQEKNTLEKFLKIRGELKEFYAANIPVSGKSTSENCSNEYNPYARMIFQQALNRIRPLIEVRKVRIAGRTYMVPASVQPDRSFHIGVRWLTIAAKIRRRNSKNSSSSSSSNQTINEGFQAKKLFRYSFSRCLALELWDAYHFQGYARQLRQELHQTVLANRAFYHYRWWVK